jgi:hypothetical protein
MAHRFLRCPPRFRRRAGITLLAWASALAFEPVAALAQENLRSSFPGRRVGGGSRGLCTARMVAHLVPPGSVYAPGSGRTLGLLQGASPEPVPLDLAFRPWSPPGTPAPAGADQRLSLPASGAGITLVNAPALARPTVWESSYRCGDGGVADAAAGLDFVAVKAPPAVSLLVPEATAEDGTIQISLSRLRTACGASVPRGQLAASFSLDPQLTAALPEQVPVRCLN